MVKMTCDRSSLGTNEPVYEAQYFRKGSRKILYDKEIVGFICPVGIHVPEFIQG
jgi:hypothetical protein